MLYDKKLIPIAPSNCSRSHESDDKTNLSIISFELYTIPKSAMATISSRLICLEFASFDI